MAKFDANVYAALRTYFEKGRITSDEFFAAWVQAIRDGLQEHEHLTAGGRHSGTGDAPPARGTLWLEDLPVQESMLMGLSGDTGWTDVDIRSDLHVLTRGILLSIAPTSTGGDTRFTYRKNKGEQPIFDLTLGDAVPAQAFTLHITLDEDRTFQRRIEAEPGASARLTELLMGQYF